MSLGYALRLSYIDGAGSVGMPEIFDPPHVLQGKIEELAMMIQKSKHLVAFTGAGISTSCGIPDFRGPKGVWTLQHEGKGVPEMSLPFHRAMPSLTHMALVALEKAGILKFVVSQNIDSLHLRSGIPREKLAELHGNSFRELCPSCGKEYLRDFEVESIGRKETSRHCSDLKCHGKLRDTVLDWDDELLPEELNPAEKHCKMADVVICLGTSLQIKPACDLPVKATHAGGKLVIVNLQPTPKDKNASLVIHGKVDEVIAGVMNLLNLCIPPYVRIELVQLSLAYRPKRKKNICWTVRISSVHGKRAPLPFIESIEVSFPDRYDLKNVLLAEQPFCLIRETLKTRPFKMVLKLNLSDGCAYGSPSTTIEWPVDFQAPVHTFIHKKDVVFQNLREEADRNSCCGQFAPIERMTRSDHKTEIEVFAIVTSLLRHDKLANCMGFEVVPESTSHILKRHNEDVGTRGSPKRPKGKAIGKTSSEDVSINLVLSDFKVPSRSRKGKEKLETKHLNKEFAKEKGIKYERQRKSSHAAKPLERTPLLRGPVPYMESFVVGDRLKDIEETSKMETLEPALMEIVGNPREKSGADEAVTVCQLEPIRDDMTEQFESAGEQPKQDIEETSDMEILEPSQMEIVGNPREKSGVDEAVIECQLEPVRDDMTQQFGSAGEQPKQDGMSEIIKSFRDDGQSKSGESPPFEYPDHFLPIVRDAAKKMIDTLVVRLSSESIVENFGSLSQDIKAIFHFIKNRPGEIQKLMEKLQILVDKEQEVATCSSELLSTEERIKLLEEELLRVKEAKASCLQRSMERKSSAKDAREKLIASVRRILD